MFSDLRVVLHQDKNENAKVKAERLAYMREQRRIIQDNGVTEFCTQGLAEEIH